MVPVACELGGALSGGSTVHERSDGQRRVLNGMFSILIDPAKLGTANNLPLAAALGTIPVLVMIAYLAIVRRTGALDEL